CTTLRIECEAAPTEEKPARFHLLAANGSGSSRPAGVFKTQLVAQQVVARCTIHHGFATPALAAHFADREFPSSGDRFGEHFAEIEVPTDAFATGAHEAKNGLRVDHVHLVLHLAVFGNSLGIKIGYIDS